MKVVRILRTLENTPIWYPNYVREKLPAHTYNNYGYVLRGDSFSDTHTTILGYVKLGYAIKFDAPDQNEITVFNDHKTIHVSHYWCGLYL